MKKLLFACLIASAVLGAIYATLLSLGRIAEAEAYVEKEITILTLMFKSYSGDAEAQYRLGNAYYAGQILPHDETKAYAWYRASAEQGFYKSQMNVGFALYFGKGVEKNIPESFTWYRKAADAGDVMSQLMLADSYYLGQEVPKDRVEAVNWYRRAAAQNSAKACLALGFAYRDGWGVPNADMAQARAWFSKAAALGEQQALQILATMPPQ